MDAVTLRTHVFPDTREGALSYLALDSALNLMDAHVYPDPVVKGVWAVETPADPTITRAIVYLAGYEKVMGEMRTVNDYECEEVVG